MHQILDGFLPVTLYISMTKVPETFVQEVPSISQNDSATSKWPLYQLSTDLRAFAQRHLHTAHLIWVHMASILDELDNEQNLCGINNSWSAGT